MTSQSQNRVHRDRSGKRPRRVLALAAWSVAVLVLIGVGTAGWLWLDRAHDRGDLNAFLCEGECGDAYVTAPNDLDVHDPLDIAATGQAPITADAEAVAQAVEARLAQPVLGSHVGVSVRQLDGTEIYSNTGDTFIPASTTKVLTAFAALTTLDPEERFVTKTVLDGDRLVLVGGGDPFLMATQDQQGFAAPASLETLAQTTAAALSSDGVTQVDLGYDVSLFTGPSVNSTWSTGYLSQNQVSPISALWTDRGRVDRVGVGDPAATAAQQFADLLTAQGITVIGVGPHTTTETSYQEVSAVEGPTVAQAVERVLLTSDNGGAEVLARHVAIKAGKEASFDGATEAVRQALADAGIDVSGLSLSDGSGLSRENRISPSLLTDLVATASTVAPELFDDLPVAGFTGSLTERFVDLPGHGTVRAKTGALNHVHSLAGTVTTADGVVLTMSVMSDSADITQPLEGRAAVDRILSSLSTCDCAG